MKAASRSLQCGTRVRVTNKNNGKSVEVVVNDYGPTRSDRMFDVTYAAAVQLDFIDQGLIDCKIETI